MSRHGTVTAMGCVVLLTGGLGVVVPAQAAVARCGGEPVTLTVQPGEPLVGTRRGDVIRGTSGPDRIDGGASGDIICGLGGDDRIAGGGRSVNDTDLILGGPGVDRLFGGPGPDDLFGGPGDDMLHGDDGGDRLRGGHGSDKLYGDLDSDHFWLTGDGDLADGGTGGTVTYATDADVTIDLAAGVGGLSGQRTVDQLRNLRNVYTGPGSDTIRGDHRRNWIYAGAGDDTVHGQTGDDTLFGQAGDDMLDGGDGSDTLYGDGWAIGPISQLDTCLGGELLYMCARTGVTG